MLVGPLRAPDDSGGGSSRIESCMRSMSLVGTTKLTMDGGIEFAAEFDHDQDQASRTKSWWDGGMMAQWGLIRGAGRFARTKFATGKTHFISLAIAKSYDSRSSHGNSNNSTQIGFAFFSCHV